jgi:hypothetical protein
MPSMPISCKAFLTASSLEGWMMASILVISRPRSVICAH